MEYRDVPKVIKGMMQDPSIYYHLIVNATRATFHPLERHLLGGWSFAPRSISIMITDRCISVAVCAILPIVSRLHSV